MSQAELAVRADVSRQWISAFEAGRPRAELGLVLRMLYALDLHLELLERDSGSSLPTMAVDLDDLLGEYEEA
jgi:HTH-type transcriptional regulator / antitoxin HipB